MGATIHRISQAVIPFANLHISKTIQSFVYLSRIAHGDQNNKEEKQREGWLSAQWQSTITAKPKVAWFDIAVSEVYGLTAHAECLHESHEGRPSINRTIHAVILPNSIHPSTGVINDYLLRHAHTS